MVNKEQLKQLLDLLHSIGIISNESNWELKIGGNEGGIRWIEKTTKLK